MTAVPSDPSARLEDRLPAEIPALRSFLGRLAGEEADDLLQEVLQRALSYRHAFDPQGSLGGWLRRIATRAFHDRLAQAARQPEALGDRDGELAAGGRTAAGAAGEEALARRELVAHLLQRLAPLEREALVRFHQGGESIAAIARALGLPEGTVKSHLHRARRKLAQVVEEER